MRWTVWSLWSYTNSHLLCLSFHHYCLLYPEEQQDVLTYRCAPTRPSYLSTWCHKSTGLISVKIPGVGVTSWLCRCNGNPPSPCELVASVTTAIILDRKDNTAALRCDPNPNPCSLNSMVVTEVHYCFVLIRTDPPISPVSSNVMEKVRSSQQRDSSF